MKKVSTSKLRILSLLIAAVMILACLPGAALAESFSAAVKSKSMKVYADPYGREYLGSLSKKTIVTVEEYVGGVARIRYNGFTGYAKVSDMRTVESFAQETETARATRVYEQPTTTSRSVKVSKGTQLYVLAVSGNIAMVERGGNVGYVAKADLALYAQNPGIELPGDIEEELPDEVIDELEKGELTQSQLEALKKALEEQAKKEQAEKEEENQGTLITISLEEAFNSGKYSNEQLCYIYARKALGYNNAAAAGLLANISAESNFNTSTSGDSGASYGICQWYSGRKSRLLNWCEDKGYDPAQLSSQLAFLKYELETYYPAVHSYMKKVSDSAQGAYDAGYYFCYNFEAPSNRASRSVTRGNNAKNTYYPRYAGYTV